MGARIDAYATGEKENRRLRRNSCGFGCVDRIQTGNRGSMKAEAIKTMNRNVATAQYYDDGLINELSTLQRDGIVGKKGAFSRKWVERLNEDMMTAFWEAIQRPGGAVGRGPRRWYVEVHPQAISGFIDIVTHPWINAMAEGVLGPDYEIVEIRIRCTISGCKTPTMAPGLSLAEGNVPGPPDYLARIQHN